MRNKVVILAIIAATACVPSALGVAFEFETLPSNGQVFAAPGSTVGWGYRVRNPTTDWLELTNVSADVFLNGTPFSLFDFPILAAGEERIVSWTMGTAGLFEFTWDLSAPVNSVNVGLFTLEGVFWDGDPLSGGASIIGQADPQSADYRVSASSTSVVPEPGALWLMPLPLMILMWRRRRVN